MPDALFDLDELAADLDDPAYDELRSPSLICSGT
jgi:hypothetical protein